MLYKGREGVWTTESYEKSYENNVWYDSDYLNAESEYICWWWLRSSGILVFSAGDVYGNGIIFSYGSKIYYGYYAVRPALVITLQS